MKNMPQALECFEIPFSNMLQAYNKEKDKINRNKVHQLQKMVCATIEETRRK